MISPTRIFRYATRLAVWMTPKVKEWHRKRDEARVEGERHLAAKNYSEAEKHLLVALELAGERHVAAGKKNALRLQLAEAQWGQKKFEEAERNVRLAIECAGSDRKLTGDALEALADLQAARGDFTGSEKTIRDAAKMAANTEALALRTAKLAKIVNGLNRRKEAIEIYESAADLHEEAFGASDPRTGAILGETGTVHRQEGNHTQAQEFLQRALKIHEVSSGASSQEATESLGQLASSLEESGDMTAAMAQYERALRMKEQQIGGKMEDLADLQARAARMYLQWGERGKSRQLLAQALPQLARKPGKNLVTALETMAALEEASGRREEAAQYRERALCVEAELNAT